MKKKTYLSRLSNFAFFFIPLFYKGRNYFFLIFFLNWTILGKYFLGHFMWSIFPNVTQSPSDGRAAFSSYSLSEAVPECRLGKSLSIADTCKSEGHQMEKKLHLAAGIWPESAHQTFFCTRKTLSARAIESFSFSLWSWVNRVASRAWPPLKLPSMLV